MTRRQGLIGGAALVALIATAFAVALYRFNAYLHDQRDALAAQASAALGRSVRFGTVGVSLHGGLSARVTDLHVAEDPRFGDGDFLHAEAVDVAIELLPALFGRYHIRHLRLQAPSITVIRTASGTNLETLGNAADVRAPPVAAPLPLSPAPRGATLASVLIASASVRGGRIDVIDRRSDPPAHLQIDRLDIAATDLAPDRPLRFELHAALASAADRNLVVAGTFDALPPNRLDIRGTLAPITVDALRDFPGLRTVLPAALESADPISATLHVSGPLDTLSLAFDVDASAAAVRYGTVFDKPMGTALTLTGEAEVIPTTAHVDVRVVQLTLGDAVIRARGRAEGVSPPTIDAALELSPVALSALAAWVPALADLRLTGDISAVLQATGPLAPEHPPEVSGRIELHNGGGDGLPFPIRDVTATIDLARNRAVLAPTTAQIGDAPVAVTCAAAPLQAPVITCTATAERLHPATLGLTHAGDDVLQALHLSATLRPGTLPVVELRSGSGVVHGIAYRDLQTTSRVEAGRVIVDSLTVHACDGTARGNGSLIIGHDAAHAFEIHAHLDGVRLTLLLASQGVTAARRFDGRLRGEMALAGMGGDDWPSMRQRLRGTARVEIADGVLRDVNLAGQVLDSLGGFGVLTQFLSPRVRDRHPGIFRSGDTRFDKLAASLRIADGRALTDDAALRSTEFAVDGRGTIYLDGRLALVGLFAASPALTGDLLGGSKDAGALLDQRGQLAIPFTVGGTVDTVHLKPDQDFVARAVQHLLIDQGLNQLLRKSGRTDAGTKPSKPANQLLQKGLEQLLGH